MYYRSWKLTLVTRTYDNSTSFKTQKKSTNRKWHCFFFFWRLGGFKSSLGAVLARFGPESAFHLPCHLHSLHQVVKNLDGYKPLIMSSTNFYEPFMGHPSICRCCTPYGYSPKAPSTDHNRLNEKVSAGLSQRKFQEIWCHVSALYSNLLKPEIILLSHNSSGCSITCYVLFHLT